MPLNPHRCSADERNHCRKPVQTLQVLMASFLWRVLSAASLFEFAAQDASLFAVVRPFLHLGFDARVRQIANALLKFPSRVISHRCSPVSRASRRVRRTDERSSDSIRTITDRMAGHRKSDRSRDGSFRGRTWSRCLISVILFPPPRNVYDQSKQHGDKDRLQDKLLSVDVAGHDEERAVCIARKPEKTDVEE